MGTVGINYMDEALNIGWFTVRKWTDLCSTTTNALAHGMVSNGHDLTVFNHDPPSHHEAAPWSHIHLERSERRGFQARSLAKSAARWLSVSSQAADLQVVLVDWPLLPTLMPTLARLNRPVVLVDRSPPADDGLFGRLQWNVWRRAWKCLRDGRIQAGIVVSPAHARFVVAQTGVREANIHPVSAGVNLDTFTPQPAPSLPLRLVYHGRLDKNRGVLALPMLVHLLNQSNVEAELTLIGEGDALPSLRDLAAERPWMTLAPTVIREDVPAQLVKHHVGLLPMPAKKVWRLASPLKRSEYLAAGLLVFGVDHEGHRLDDVSEAWYRLVDQADFLIDGVAWLKQLDEQALIDGRTAARAYAEAWCSWNTSVDALMEALAQAIES